MKNLILIFGLTLLIASCSLFENKEKQAIEICQRTKVQFVTDNAYANSILNSYMGKLGLDENATWLDYANMQVKKETDTKYQWRAKPTDENGIYIVAFVDNNNWGYRWEVDINQQIVKFVNQNEYLCRKYGLSKFDPDGNFVVNNISVDTLKLATPNAYYSNGSKEITYILKASVINKTGKTLTDADISGTLQVIFKDKTIDADDYNSGFFSSISTSNPWKPDTEKDFYIQTKGIEPVYLDYEPEYVFFEVNVKAEDPIGFSYDKNIAEYDLKDKWKNLKR